MGFIVEKNEKLTMPEISDTEKYGFTVAQAK
jgi:hypothetical protein